MEKIKQFGRKHKRVLITGGLSILSFVGGAIVTSVLGQARDKNMSSPTEPKITINPDYYGTFDEAVAAFKELQKETDHAVLFDSYGTDYGVFDESILLGEPKKQQ